MMRKKCFMINETLERTSESNEKSKLIKTRCGNVFKNVCLT